MFTPVNAFRSTKRFCKGRSFRNALRNFESSDSASKQIYSPLFFDEKVQNLLYKMTNAKLETIFRLKPTGESLKPPTYKLLTTEEVDNLMKEFKNKAKYYLQIPPLVDVNEVESEILDGDTSLDGYDEHHSKHIFVDTSNNVNNNDRAIVVREANGVLRTASHSERVRIAQIYFPMSGREIHVPKMFTPENIKNILDREDYEFLLDRACVQFEPFDRLYHQTIGLAYEAINEKSHFERLHSTRHFGSLVFYLVTHKKIDNLLLDNIKKNRMDDAYNLIQLYHIIHPGCKSAQLSSGKGNREILRDFIELDSNTKDVLSLTLNVYESKEQERQEFEAGIKNIHGL